MEQMSKGKEMKKMRRNGEEYEQGDKNKRGA